MRTLLLLRGSAGVGKSTWIHENHLDDYTLSADTIRMMCSTPKLGVCGNYGIDQSNDKFVWETLFNILEMRMKNGEFTVIDATNSKTSEMNRYKDLCEEYKYRIYCVDFTDVPIEVVKERNRNREPIKRVPEEVIDKMYSRFATQKIPSGITVIKPDELGKVWVSKYDFDKYNKVHIIGDIHGCFTALNEYLANGIKEDESYIFCGDYIDRGIENAQVIKFLLEIYKKNNVLLLEGNHEHWLWDWANDNVAKSKEFEFITKKELDNSNISKPEVRQLYRKFAQCAYFEYRGKTYLITHGGLSTLPNNLTLVSTSQIIKGVGSYGDAEDVDNNFIYTTNDTTYQIHGHRNIKHLPIKVNDRCFNLEGKIEFGGMLRCVDLLPNGDYETFEIKNNVFSERTFIQARTSTKEEKSVGDTVLEMRASKFIQEKEFGNISSFNFTRDAFYDKVWNDTTTKARGLYINIPKQKVVARAYDKFFNINEREETRVENLCNSLQFPVTAYVKENGFLGIVAYNEEDDGLLITSKSTIGGEFSDYLKNIINEKMSSDAIDKLKIYSKENNVSFVFECIDMKNDPHIIDYGKNKLVLLDVIYNSLTYSHLPYENMVELAIELGLEYKEQAYTIDNWQDFYDWYCNVISEDYKYKGKNIEGFVIEDANGYMLKVKLAYYNFWKFMRSIAHETLKKGYADKRRLSLLTTPIANAFYGFVKSLYEFNKESIEHGGEEIIPNDICTLRKMFLNSNDGEVFKNEG